MEQFEDLELGEGFTLRQDKDFYACDGSWTMYKILEILLEKGTVEVSKFKMYSSEKKFSK